MSKRYELEEVASEYLPAQLRDPVRWLRRHLNDGTPGGRRFGRHWVMMQADIEHMLTVVSAPNEADLPEPKPAEPESPSFLDGLSPRSRRRLKAVQ